MGKLPSVTPDGGFALIAEEKSSPVVFGRYLSAGEKAFLEKTGFTPSGLPPVNVVLHSSSENLPSLPALNVDAMESGVPRISVHLKSDKKGIETTQLLVAALMLRELYGERAPAPGSRVPRYPDWVMRGLATLCFPQEAPLRIPRSYLKGGSPPDLEDFLTQRPPGSSDPSLSDLYDAMSSMLLKAGLAAPAGQAAFRKWVVHEDFKKSPDKPMPRWVEGWEMKAVEKRWLLLMVGSPEDGDGAVRLQNTRETLKAYDIVMAEGLSGGVTISSLSRDRKTGPYTLGRLSARLRGIRLRGNPLVIPLIDRTLILVENAPRLSKGKIEDEQKALTELRGSILKKSTEIEAYLDWYEAMKLPVRSGYFERLLKTPESEVKKGPVGRHLDAVEVRGW